MIITQTNKKASKQANKQTNKQAKKKNKQVKKRNNKKTLSNKQTCKYIALIQTAVSAKLLKMLLGKIFI